MRAWFTISTRTTLKSTPSTAERVRHQAHTCRSTSFPRAGWQRIRAAVAASAMVVIWNLSFQRPVSSTLLHGALDLLSQELVEAQNRRLTTHDLQTGSFSSPLQLHHQELCDLVSGCVYCSGKPRPAPGLVQLSVEVVNKPCRSIAAEATSPPGRSEEPSRENGRVAAAPARSDKRAPPIQSEPQRTFGGAASVPELSLEGWKEDASANAISML